MYVTPEVETVNLNSQRERKEIQEFLTQFDLTYEGNAEYSIVMRADGRLIATGSFAGEILCNIAVDDALQGMGLTATIVTELMREQVRRGRLHYFLFTRPAKAHLFEALGFAEIARAEPYAALLESGLGSVKSFCDDIRKQFRNLDASRAAIVVNCNPFTKGHEALIRLASQENEEVVVFVVSEDRSLFPFPDRFHLVKVGCAALANVIVVPTGPYMVSSATFPTYFTREEDKVTAQTRLDVAVFAAQIAPRLGISVRYVGEEPYCPVTNAYNQAMQEILPTYGIALKRVNRYQTDGDIVSASKVRELIRRNDWNGIARCVPTVTLDYLKSPEAAEVLENIRNSASRH